jgi:hypothetical protein
MGTASQAVRDEEGGAPTDRDDELSTRIRGSHGDVAQARRTPGTRGCGVEQDVAHTEHQGDTNHDHTSQFARVRQFQEG